MNIDFLSNHPDKIKEVSEMVFKEFVMDSASSMKLEEVVKHFSTTKDNAFPITLVALENGECLGTVSIFKNDLKIRDMYKPWLASLYTKPEYRGRGVGQKLVAKTIDVVKELGFKELYLRTEDASDYYRNSGWTYIETVSDDKYERIDVFKVKCI
ncbi:GNAT family N-acetyltransferase [Aquibacillus koreensis]|uniref:GNAT family N-acetyltransferase n=1 Tax=Aquibacillus koreensis TaxID=279446 RepID=A0A9X4AH20_9BACI|nr:GNAT family N-acetyltransferase [Aquibacillus koreensis]MCT2534728.1 GNAT family N-acetyltransferase [Aquibacillus koreensis]MDC3419662.1 GNAT family N-acetyltransferase [Aquibacillus koreensis]